MTDLEFNLITSCWLAANVGLLLLLRWVRDNQDEWL